MDFEFTYKYSSQDDRWIIGIVGEIDIYNSAKLKESLAKLIDEKACDLFILCDDLEYIDSTGLGALVSTLKKVKQYQKNIHLINVKSNIYKIFKITGLNKVFVIEGGDYE